MVENTVTLKWGYSDPVRQLQASRGYKRHFLVKKKKKREREAKEVSDICGSVTLQDLSGSSVAHALLAGSLVGPHL